MWVMWGGFMRVGPESARMSREIRITIDDDEIFERMKRRKDELDLSWEEALRRGLDRNEDAGPGSASGTGARAHRSSHAGRAPHGEPHASHGRPGGHAGADEGRRSVGDSGEWNPFDPDFGRKLSEHITRSVAESVPGGEDLLGPGSLEEEIDQLEDAEDAVLAFPFLDDEPGNQVPLRVNLRTSADGLDVEVVAVRRGKSVASMNRFEADARGAVTRKLAAGEPAMLRMRDGQEEYPVSPALSWSRDRDGRPTVTEVEIAEVRLDEE